MKIHGIQRAVQAHPIERSPGDEPSLGRLERMRGGAAPKGGNRRRIRHERSPGGSGRGSGRTNQRKIIRLWSALFAFVALTVVGVALWSWLQEYMPQDDDAALKSQPAPEIQERVVSRFESPTEAVALDRVKQALQMRDPSQVAEYFHLGSASPAVVAGFLRDMEQADGAVTGYQWLSSMDANGLLLDGVTVNTLAAGKPRYRLALLTPDASGNWKIDFDAFARTVKPAWSEFMSPVKPAEQGLVRVMLVQDNYYNGVFKDEARWICYKIASPDVDNDMLAYCRKGSPQAQALARIESDRWVLAGAGSPSRATLQIRRVAGAESRQFEITRVWAEDWAMSATPFDQNFR